jgi:hypothetical protein
MACVHTLQTHVLLGTAFTPKHIDKAVSAMCWDNNAMCCRFLLELRRCGTAALVSFTWGVLVETGTIVQLPRALAGISAILLGIAGVAGAGALQQAIAAQQQQGTSQQARVVASAAAAAEPQQQLQQPLLSDVEQNGVSSTAAGVPSDSSSRYQAEQQQQQQQQQQQRGRMIVGLLLAIVTGVLGGLILAPMDYVGRECRGLPYQAALAVGVLVAALPVTYCLHWLQSGKVSMSAGACWCPWCAASVTTTSTLVCNYRCFSEQSTSKVDRMPVQSFQVLFRTAAAVEPQDM